MKVIFTDQAEENLEEIGDYIANKNPDRAETFVGELRQRALNIGTFPEAYQVVGRYENFKVRRCVHGDYLIFYRIAKRQVEVFLIVHGAKHFDLNRF